MYEGVTKHGSCGVQNPSGTAPGFIGFRAPSYPRVQVQNMTRLSNVREMHRHRFLESNLKWGVVRMSANSIAGILFVTRTRPRADDRARGNGGVDPSLKGKARMKVVHVGVKSRVNHVPVPCNGRAKVPPVRPLCLTAVPENLDLNDFFFLFDVDTCLWRI